MTMLMVSALDGHTVATTGAAEIISTIGYRSAAVITFGDGTVLDIDVEGRITQSTTGTAKVLINDSLHGQVATVIGDLRSVRIVHGGSTQGTKL